MDEVHRIVCERLMKLPSKGATSRIRSSAAVSGGQTIAYSVYSQPVVIHEDRTMIWQLCIQYASGRERVLRSYKNRETALKCVDAIYAKGYPLHIAYVVRHAQVQMA